MMKAVRIFSVVLALALFAGAIFPFAAKPVDAQTNQTIMVTSPVEAFLDASRGMPLLAPMSITIPAITVNVESAFSDYACRLSSQKPKNYTRMVSRQIFDMTWRVKNTGKKIWAPYTIPVKYISGTKMQTYTSDFYIRSQIGIGGSTTLLVDMIAPKQLGFYSATWGLYAGKKPFCFLTVTINVASFSKK